MLPRTVDVRFPYHLARNFSLVLFSFALGTEVLLELAELVCP